jgi:hypothetical protein
LIKTSEVISEAITLEAKTSSGRSASFAMTISTNCGVVTEIIVTSQVNKVIVEQESTDVVKLIYMSGAIPNECSVTK